MNTQPIFTPEAERLLLEEIVRLRGQVMDASVDEALATRGEPVEVTASDVRRAVSRLTWQRGRLGRRMDRVLRLYTLMGIGISLFGVLYFLADTILTIATVQAQIAFMTVVIGLALSGVMWAFRWYLADAPPIERREPSPPGADDHM